MKLTKAQKEALENAPLFLAQSEVNNSLAYVSDSTDKEFQCRTVQVLIDNGFLIDEGNMLIKS